MAIVNNLVPVQFVGLHHIVLYRAFFFETLNLADMADRYLETGRDLVKARHALLKTQDALLTIGRRNGLSQQDLSLIMLPPNVRRRVSEVERLIKKLKQLQKEHNDKQAEGELEANIISFEDFIAQFDPEGYLGEEEQLQSYYAEIGYNYNSPSQEIERENLRITDRMLGFPEDFTDDDGKEYSNEELEQLEAQDVKVRRRTMIINQLAAHLVKTPSVKDPVEGWFHPKVAERLMKANLFTLGQIIRHINTFGWNWFSYVPKLGKQTAKKIRDWLLANGDYLEEQVHPFALQKEMSIVVVDSPRDVVIDADSQYLVRKTGFTPLELFKAPDQLDGSMGMNRAERHLNKMSARNDYEAIVEWLSIHGEKTRLSYKKEAERLLMWSIMSERKPLSSLTVADMVNYQKFLLDPQPAHLWIGKKRLPRTHPAWKPFTGKLSESSITYAFIVLSGLFEFLVSQQYLQSNPIKAVPKNIKGKRTTIKTNRMLPVRLWNMVEEKIAEVNVEDTIAYRTAFIIKFVYMTGLRLEEITNVRLGDFFAVEKDNGQQSWRLKVLGKGSKTREVFLVESGMKMVSDYLKVKGLPTDPRLSDKSIPLITHLQSLDALSKNHLYTTIKDWFKQLAEPLKDTQPMDYQLLSSVSTHWLRHTFASRLVKKAELPILMKMLGHSNLQTTSVYVNVEDEEGEKAMESVFG